MLCPDPIYRIEDKTVLAEAGFTVVDDPRGVLHVDDASVVISVSPDIPVRQIVADIARPAIVIWNRVEGSTSDTDRPWQVTFLSFRFVCRFVSLKAYVHIKLTANSADPESPRVRQMMEEYIEVPFPAQQHFKDVAIYVRKGDERGK